ncbi:MAG: hypothetical protein IKZ04_02565 [Spirochaetaceae bacterium]|nr:hypothetical protein [Spirochaetaceae bacterium]
MLQFYFLSVLLNLITGLILFCSEKNVTKEIATTEEVQPQVQEKNDVLGFMDNKNFKLVLGVLSVLVGLMKLLSVVQNDVPVIGDLLPSAAGLVGGFCILLDFYKNSSTVEMNPNKFVQFVSENQKSIGIFCIVVAVLHFIFPKVLFL